VSSCRSGTLEHELVQQYKVLKFFWQNFGMKEDELSSKSLVWIDSMMVVDDAMDEERANNITRSISQAPRVTTNGGRITQSKTLMEF